MSEKSPPVTPLYVRLPAKAGDKLDRASETLGLAKKDIVTELVERYLDPPRSPPSPGQPTLGWHSFQAYDPPEVMSSEQAAQFLQIDEPLVIELADAGKLPG